MFQPDSIFFLRVLLCKCLSGAGADWVFQVQEHIIRSRLGPKSLRGNRFYKGHIDMAENTSFPPKMYLKSLADLEKALVSLKSLQE
jgi:hypothetical protein